MYGRVDARIKIPYAKGIWPAFWMLGDPFPGTPWPSSGEIDIMECFGAARGPVASNRGTLHGPGYAGAGVTREYLLPGGRGIDSDFYVFSIEWVADRVRFFVDNHQYLEATPNDLPPRGAWVFNGAKFFMLLNLPSVDRQHQSGNQTEQRPSRSPCLWTTFGFTSVAGDRAHARYTLPTMRDQHPAKVGAIE